MSLFLTIVLDGVGIGAQPDSAQYGDEDSNTLGHVCAVAKPHLPNLSQLGLGCIEPLHGVPPAEAPRAHYGKMMEASAGKDSTTGHWELAGLRLNDPFPTYPAGFPQHLIDAFVEQTGCGAVLGNRPDSGTLIISDLGEQHMQTSYPIVYTSADSVFQVAAHKDIIPLSELYRLCDIARREVFVDEHAVGRVIARPFLGQPGAFSRVSAERKDFSRLPEQAPLQQVLQQQGVRTVSVGKVADLFGGIGFDDVGKTKSNDHGIETLMAYLHHYREGDPATFIWANLVDFDQEYGHRNEVAGFARALEEFDRSLPEVIDILPPDAHMVITADHGNDPTTASTDHAREYVPVLYHECDAESSGTNLGIRSSFNDHAASVAAYFGSAFQTEGTPLLA